MTRAYRYRVYPGRLQALLALKILDLCRWLYNSALQHRRDAYRKKRVSIRYRDQQNVLPTLKEEIPVLKTVHSQVLQDVLRRLQKAYDNFFRRVKEGAQKKGYPRFKGKNRYCSITYPQSGFKILEEGKFLWLSGTGKMRMVYHRPIPEGAKIKTCTLKRFPSNEWYVTWVLEDVPLEDRKKTGRTTGVDVGLEKEATTGDGRYVEPPKFLQRALWQIRLLSRRLSRKKPGSKNREKARVKLARAHQKVRNQRTDFLHKLSRWLVESYDLISFESLNIAGMVQNPSLARAILDAGWGTLIRFATYKAEGAGGCVVKVWPAYTSWECHRCHGKVPKTLAERMHECPVCGLRMDRDWNAANVIDQRGVMLVGPGWPEPESVFGSNACGDGTAVALERELQVRSLKQEAPTVRSG